jgi:hypothetical protein
MALQDEMAVLSIGAGVLAMIQAISLKPHVEQGEGKPFSPDGEKPKSEKGPHPAEGELKRV